MSSLLTEYVLEKQSHRIPGRNGRYSLRTGVVGLSRLLPSCSPYFVVVRWGALEELFPSGVGAGIVFEFLHFASAE